MEARRWQEDTVARSVASLPARLGGLGLRSATRTAPAAYWAGWFEAFVNLRQRLPASTQRRLELLREDDHAQLPPCLQHAADAAAELERKGVLYFFLQKAGDHFLAH